MIKSYKAFQPVTVVNAPTIKLVRFGDYYPAKEELWNPESMVNEVTIELPEEIADLLGFKEVAVNG